jgi:hypothetical protein
MTTAWYFLKMTSIEKIPQEFEDEFNPRSEIDHELIALYTGGRILGAKGPRKELQRVYDFFRHTHPKLIEWIVNNGKFVEPYDDELKPIDGEYIKLKAFSIGSALALQALTIMAYEADISQNVWKEVWANMPALPMDQDVEIRTPEECHKLGATILEHGGKWLASAPGVYTDLVEDVASKYPQVVPHMNIFRSGFGYTFATGNEIVGNLITDKAIEEELLKVKEKSNDHIFNEDLKSLLRIERKLQKKRTHMQ